MALSLFAGTSQYQLPGNLGGIDNMQCRAEQTYPSVHPANKQCDTSSWPFPMTTKQRRRQYHNNRATRSNEAARAFARNPIDADNTTWYLAPGSACRWLLLICMCCVERRILYRTSPIVVIPVQLAGNNLRQKCTSV